MYIVLIWIWVIVEWRNKKIIGVKWGETWVVVGHKWSMEINQKSRRWGYIVGWRIWRNFEQRRTSYRAKSLKTRCGFFFCGGDNPQNHFHPNILKQLVYLWCPSARDSYFVVKLSIHHDISVQKAISFKIDPSMIYHTTTDSTYHNHIQWSIECIDTFFRSIDWNITTTPKLSTAKIFSSKKKIFFLPKTPVRKNSPALNHTQQPSPLTSFPCYNNIYILQLDQL